MGGNPGVINVGPATIVQNMSVARTVPADDTAPSAFTRLVAYTLLTAGIAPSGGSIVSAGRAVLTAGIAPSGCSVVSAGHAVPPAHIAANSSMAPAGHAMTPAHIAASRSTAHAAHAVPIPGIALSGSMAPAAHAVPTGHIAASASMALTARAVPACHAVPTGHIAASSSIAPVAHAVPAAPAVPVADIAPSGAVLAVPAIRAATTAGVKPAAIIDLTAAYSAPEDPMAQASAPASPGRSALPRSATSLAYLGMPALAASAGLYPQRQQQPQDRELPEQTSCPHSHHALHAQPAPYSTGRELQAAADETGAPQGELGKQIFNDAIEQARIKKVTHDMCVGE